MKKKSLLILPVLLLALAACNNDEEEVEPEDNTPEVTDPSGNQGTDDGGDGGEKEPVVDTRITLTEGEVVLNEVDEGETPVTYANPSDGSLSIDKGVVGEDGSITYTVTGTAPTLSAEQAEDFWSGHAAEGDKFIIINVAFNEDEAVSWVSSAGDTRVRTVEDYEDGSMDVIIRISGKDVSEDKLAGTATYTIGEVPAEGEDVTGVKHIVDFTALFDTRITITEGEVDDEKWTNDSSLSFASVKTDESGNVTYVLDGELSKMTPDQATAFGAGAQENDEYVLLTVTLKEGETVTWGYEIEETNKTRDYETYPNGMDVVLKVTSEGASSVKFTIANSTASTSVDHIVDLSAYVTTSEGE